MSPTDISFTQHHTTSLRYFVLSQSIAKSIMSEPGDKKTEVETEAHAAEDDTTQPGEEWLA